METVLTYAGAVVIGVWSARAATSWLHQMALLLGAVVTWNALVHLLFWLVQR